VTCPECGSPLMVPKSIRIIGANGSNIVEPVGAWCRSTILCDYGAISIDDPNTPHPKLVSMRRTRSNEKQFREYVSDVFQLIPETEIDPQRCAGRPVFTKSRLPVEIIMSLIMNGVGDTEIIEGYPRMTKFILTIIRGIMESIPRS